MYFKTLLPLLSLLAFGAFASQNPIVKPYPIPETLNSAHAKHLYAYRNQIHHDALMRIKNDFKISDADWNWYMDYVHELLSKDSLFSQRPIAHAKINDTDHWLVKEAKEVLIDCGIDPNRITIVLDYNFEVNGSAHQNVSKDRSEICHTLTLNPSWFAQFSKEDREAILLHEIMHFANYDHFEEGFIYGMLQRAGYTPEQIDASAAMIYYRQQREARADLLSVVDKPALAEVNQKRYARTAHYSSEYPHDFWKTHPSHQTRAENMAQLLEYINQPIWA